VEAEAIYVLARSQCLLEDKSLVNTTKLGYRRGVLDFGNVSLSERFEGMSLSRSKGSIGIQDILSGNATNPLTLFSNSFRQNLYVDKYCAGAETDNSCQLRIRGCGSAGDKGTGAISLLFNRNERSVQMKFWKSGAATGRMIFYKENGELLNELDLDLEASMHYNFKSDGIDIKGVAIFPTGTSLNWHKFGILGICFD